MTDAINPGFSFAKKPSESTGDIHPDFSFSKNRASTPARVGPSDPAVAAYNRLNPYEKAFRAADDLVRLFSTGATYGAVDALSPEQARLTDEARRRFPVAGTLAEFGGGVASPITRTIGAGARALTPVGKGLWNWLGRAAVTSGEGATIGATGAVLSGRPEDALRDATVGAVLPHALGVAGKSVSVPSKYMTSWLANRAPRQYETAFNVGRSGTPEANQSFQEGLNRKPQSFRDTENNRAYNAGRAMSTWWPSARSLRAAASLALPAYVVHPATMAAAGLAPFIGSPRLGANIAHGIGSVLGGADMVGSRGALPALGYEQYRRRRYPK